jgi:UDP-galactopyranose mutase
MKFAIIGTGFSGAVLAHRLAQAFEDEIIVFDERGHLGGNSHTARDPETGIMEHRYGPHVFHTSNRRVWDFVNGLATFRPFINRVKAVTPRGVFSLPINLLTINQFFDKNLRPDEARDFIRAISDQTIAEPANFEEQALQGFGRDLYEAFFRGYTIKQWGVDPQEIPASVLRRLPLRFNYDDNYYHSLYQGIPEEGYTEIIGKLLASPRISVRLHARFTHADIADFDQVFYTGPLDALYGHAHGRLGYRTVYFENQRHAGDHQGNPIINYTAQEIPYTRTIEHKHFTPWEKHERTLVSVEYSKATGEGDIPGYPMCLAADQARLVQYQALARREANVAFLGRLATYRYLDMHAVIGEALEFADAWIARKRAGGPLPVLAGEPVPAPASAG